MPSRMQTRDGTMKKGGIPKKRTGPADTATKTRNGNRSGTNRHGRSRAGPAMMRMRMIGRRTFLLRIRLHR